MGKWLDIAAQMEAENPCANSVISAESPIEAIKSGASDTIGTIGTEVMSPPLPLARLAAKSETVLDLGGVPANDWNLPHETYWRLRRLSLSRPATIAMPQPLWAALVCDTVLFAKRGWAAKAMALGWSETELFGLAPRGWQGATSRLIGREVLGLDANTVAVRDGHHVAHLPRMALAADAVLIWEVGKR